MIVTEMRLAITNNLWSEWPYISVDPWRLPKLTIPKGHLGGDPSDFSLCITDIEYREIYFKQIIHDRRLKNKLPNNQFWSMSRKKLISGGLPQLAGRPPQPDCRKSEKNSEAGDDTFVVVLHKRIEPSNKV